MKTDKFSIRSFKPLYLTVEKTGPFQENPGVFDFTNETGAPCNFYLLISANGRGKTTVLELMALLMDMLKHREKGLAFGYEALEQYHGRVQWDILLKVFRQGREQTVVLSLLAGSFGDSLLSHWNKEALEGIGATSWDLFGINRHPSGRLEYINHSVINNSDALVDDLLSAVRISSDNSQTDPENTLPTLLYFSAYRDIPCIAEPQRGIVQPDNWGYRPVHKFGNEGEQWTSSLDSLLVWFSWLEEGRLERVRDTVNTNIFEAEKKFLKGIRKSPPEAIVISQGREHSLDKLSSGEKSLVQLLLRIGAHMTKNTVLLIDEMDIHLHPKWQHRLLNLLKRLVKDHPGLTVIATTHSREILRGFAYEIREKGIRKGGYIIEEDIEEM